MKALILAGGFGKRLRPYTENIPKPLVRVKGKPILVHQIEWLKKFGIRDIVLAVGYLKEKVIEEIGSGKNFGVRVAYVVEEEPLGTAGAIKNAENVLHNEKFFFVLNGDIITDIDLNVIIDKILNSGHNVLGVLALVPLPSPYGIIEIDDEGRILQFREKPVLRNYWINAGVYCFRPEIFEYLPEKGDIERTAFPKLAEEGKLLAVPFENVFWKAIDTHKDIEEAEKLLERKS
ncbi:MAG: nucleotidyltransferase family protein [Candidatus Njordarchaeales archaeon]